MLGLDPPGKRESLVFLHTEVTDLISVAGILAQGMAVLLKVILTSQCVLEEF